MHPAHLVSIRLLVALIIGKLKLYGLICDSTYLDRLHRIKFAVH
jgi:hypothetical protein